MNNTQKKALEAIVKELKSFSSYEVYSKTSKALDELSIEKGNQRKILDAVNRQMTEESSKVNEALRWVEAMLKDVEDGQAS